MIKFILIKYLKFIFQINYILKFNTYKNYFQNTLFEEAINEGISQAPAEAAIRAIMDVLAAGGTEEEAMNACRSIAGSACD